MSVNNDVLTAVIALAQATSPYATILRGALPADNGITMTASGGAPETTFADKGAVCTLDIVINGKHEEQEKVADALNKIHEALTKAKTFTSATAYQIMNIITTSEPNYIDRELNNQFLYGSSVEVTFYRR